MTVLGKLDELARKIPGVGDYLDRENARAADKALREQLATEIARFRRSIDGLVRAYAERRAFAVLPLLDRLGTKLDGVAGAVRFAAHGYRPLCDRDRADLDGLRRLYDYDRDLATQIETIKAHVDGLSAADEAALEREGQVLEKLIETFADAVQRRQNVLSAAE